MEPGPVGSALLPLADAKAFAKAAKAAGKAPVPFVTLTLSDTAITLVAGSTTLTATPVDKTYPDYVQLVRREDAAEPCPMVAVDAVYLERVCKAAKLGIGRSDIPSIQWRGHSKSSPVVVLVGTTFVAVIMPIFLNDSQPPAANTIGDILSGSPVEASDEEGTS